MSTTTATPPALSPAALQVLKTLATRGPLRTWPLYVTIDLADYNHATQLIARLRAAGLVESQADGNGLVHSIPADRLARVRGLVAGLEWEPVALRTPPVSRKPLGIPIWRRVAAASPGRWEIPS